MVVSKACLSLWRTQNSFGHKPACLDRALHMISCHVSFDKGLAMKPEQKQRCKCWERGHCWQLSSQSPRTGARGGGCSPGLVLLYRQETLQTLLEWELVRETIWIWPASTECLAILITSHRVLQDVWNIWQKIYLCTRTKSCLTPGKW